MPLSDVSLRRQASMTQAEKPDPLLLKSDVNLFNHLVRKADVAVVVLRVLFFVDMSCPVFSVAGFVLSEVVFTLLMHQLLRYLRHNWIFDGLMASTRCDM